MFNTNERILHLYECIDELRAEIQEIRHRQLIDGPHRDSLGLDPYGLNLFDNDFNYNFNYNNLNSRNENRRNRLRNTTSNQPAGINWSVERNTPSTRNSTSTASNRRERRTTGTNNPSPLTNSILTGLTTPDSVEFTFFEPQISNVRQRLDTLLERLQRNNRTPRTTTRASGTDNNQETLGTLGTLGTDDNETRRLTLEEINNGCETKIHSGEPETCTICREPINDQSIVREIKNCRHKFHLHCIDIWFENRRTCPLCRCDVVLNSESTNDTVVNDLD
tara:strand:- start:144 stop:977 length:834 start_codon:yes stop_codon:yes gene_type:complete